MTAPRRWKDSLDAPLGVRDLLAASRPPRALDRAAFERGRSRVATVALAPAAAAAIASVWPKLAAAGLVAVAAAGTAVAIDATRAEHRDPRPVGTMTAPPTMREIPAPVDPVSEPEPAPVMMPVPAPVPVTLHPAPVPVIATAAPAAVAPAPPEATPVAAAPPAAADLPQPVEPAARPASTLASELALLEDARSRLSRDPETTLRLTAAHRARFPSGLLAAERDLLEIDALLRQGRVQDARVRSAAWLAREPNGIHADRLRAIVAE
jgi:hypothetical protein